MRRTEDQIIREAQVVAQRDFPTWVGHDVWKLKRMGSAELDALLAEAVAAREPVDIRALEALEIDMREYDAEGM
jgi:hypothetical protein